MIDINIPHSYPKMFLTLFLLFRIVSAIIHTISYIKNHSNILIQYKYKKDIGDKDFNKYLWNLFLVIISYLMIIGIGFFIIEILKFIYGLDMKISFSHIMGIFIVEEIHDIFQYKDKDTRIGKESYLMFFIISDIFIIAYLALFI